MTDRGKFLPGIFDYLETLDNRKSVSVQNLEYIIFEVQVRTGLNWKTSSLLVKMFFHEIRNSMLRQEVVTFRGLGKFFISSPKSSANKKRVFPVFKPYKNLTKRLNDL